jgi:prenyltransferase/squalene oxidase-like repeat protein
MLRPSRIVSIACCVALATAPLASQQDPAQGTTPGPKERDPGRLLTPRVETAIDRGLAYLKSTQTADGHWGGQYPVAHTALSLIAFMMRGNFPREKPYGDVMEKGLDFLLRESKANAFGYMGTNMYAHGLATLALSELWGQTDRDKEVREAIKRAVQVILLAQNREGGWRYNPKPESADVSVTAMQLVALNSAKQAGILVPDETIQKAIRYVNACHNTDGGFSYMPRGGSAFPRSAAAVFSLMMCGEHESPAVKQGLGYLENLGTNTIDRGSHWAYGHYYAALCMYVGGDDTFDRWYPMIRDRLLASQTRDGSIRPPSENQQPYATAMSLIVLSIPYSYVPVYQR